MRISVSLTESRRLIRSDQLGNYLSKLFVRFFSDENFFRGFKFQKEVFVETKKS